MSVHKHYDMIVAKAGDMGLVVFNKTVIGEWVEQEYSETDVKFSQTGYGYFLCLPQNKEACLHWLNGGDVEYISAEDRFPKYHPMNWDKDREWSKESPFMRECMTLRKAPTKEKRWIAIDKDGNIKPLSFPTEEECRTLYDLVANQFIEIEMEV